MESFLLLIGIIFVIEMLWGIIKLGTSSNKIYEKLKDIENLLSKKLAARLFRANLELDILKK
jgi:hypothetical protein